MKEKNIKFIMELIFIFILPLLFILPNVSINNNYIYDNDGNFETSTKGLTYNSIVYNVYYKNYLHFNQLSESFTDYRSYNVLSSNSYTYIGSSSVIESYINHKYLFLQYVDSSDLSSVQQFAFNLKYNNSNVINLVFSRIDSRLYYFYDNLLYDNLSFDSFVFTNNVDGSIITNNVCIIDLTFMFGTGYEPNDINDFINYVNIFDILYYVEDDIIEYNDEDIISIDYNSVKSPFIYIKDLISGFLNIDKDNLTFNIVIDYTSIWFLMFVLWHLVYCLFDFIIHLIRIKRKE